MAGGPAAASGGGIETSSILWAIIISAFAGFGGILFGYDTGTIGGVIAMPDWLDTFGIWDPDTQMMVLATNKKSLVVSILSAGTFVGALLAQPIGDTIGRKLGIISACFVFCLGVGLQLDTHWGIFIAGRVVAGVGVGLVSCLVPMYQSECAPKSIRGFIVGLYQLAITIGSLIAAIVLNSTKDKPNHSAWRIPIGIQFAWAAILVGGMACLPESPRYLLLKGKVDSARVSLGKLMTLPPNSTEVDSAAREISDALAVEMREGAGSWLDCFRNTENKNGLRTWTGMAMQAWQQLTGINFIFYYGTTFFQSAGISNPFVITIICDVVNSAMTVVGIHLIDRVGRRRLLLIGAAGMCVCEFIVAIVGVTVGGDQSIGTVAPTSGVNLPAQKVLIAFTCFYIAFFAISWGPVIWVLTGELFPLSTRGKSMSLAVASNWAWNFGIGYSTPYLVNPSSSGVTGIKAADLGVKVFFIWGATCVGCFIFTYFFIPETKGLSLEQVDLLYRESNVLNSEKYRKKLLAEGPGSRSDRDGQHSPVSEETASSTEKASATHSA